MGALEILGALDVDGALEIVGTCTPESGFSVDIVGEEVGVIVATHELSRANGMQVTWHGLSLF